MILQVQMLKCFRNRDFLEQSHADDLQDFAERTLEMESFFDDGDQHVDSNGNPNLGLHRVGGGAVEGLDAEVLLDPFEEQFDPPAAAIEFGNGQSRKREVVRQEDESSPGFRVPVTDATKRIGIVLRAPGTFENDGLIASQTGRFVHPTVGSPLVIEVAFGSGQEEGQVLSKGIQTTVVDIGAVHEIEGGRFRSQFVEDADVVCFGIGDADKAGNTAA